jgi:hypothetical protein
LLLTPLRSDDNDTTFLLKLNFFFVRSFSNGSKSDDEETDDDGTTFSETNSRPQDNTLRKQGRGMDLA